MSKFNYTQVKFLLSAVKLDQLPPDYGIEVALVGHSNAGKSSALNVITNQKKLARVSKTPGRTQAINIFELDSKRRIMDLPGYGYAKVPKETQDHWLENINQYLHMRRSLKGLILIMDIRHPFKKLDQQLLDWAEQSDLSVHIVLTKADKLNRNELAKQIKFVEKCLFEYTKTTCQIFSSLTKEGLPEVLEQLDIWFSEVKA